MQAKAMSLSNPFLAKPLPSIPIRPFSLPTKPTTARPISAAATFTPTSWSLESWKSKQAFQLPECHDLSDLESVVKTLEESFPPIAFAGEARSLEENLGLAALGNAFLLMGGDSAETFPEFSPNNMRDTFRSGLELGASLMFGYREPVLVKAGRMADQFAKPWSNPFEEKDGVKLDNVNGDAFFEKSRIPDHQRMATLDRLRYIATSSLEFMAKSSRWNYFDFAQHGKEHRVDDALGFMNAYGLTADHPVMTTAGFWTSHECLLLPYEQAITRMDSTSGLYYDCSAHMLWVGERTRQLDGAHVEFLRGVSNPLGIKVSDKMNPNELVKLIDILNPDNKPGRITVTVRLGAENMRVKLPGLIGAVREAGQVVTWVSNPMHGNTIKAPRWLKRRMFRAELAAFFDVHKQEGSFPGGVHLEMMTGQKVYAKETRGTTLTATRGSTHLSILSWCSPLPLPWRR